jgi:hypothetical protein
MAILVPITYNACLAGFVAGCNAGALGASGASNTAAQDELVAAGQAVAAAVDQAVGADATLATGGASFVPTTAAQTNAMISKPAAMRQVTFAAVQGAAYAVIPTGAALAALVAVIKDNYTLLIAGDSIV